jgi:DNA-directed RNA polymerase specialized sigma24 family protein
MPEIKPGMENENPAPLTCLADDNESVCQSISSLARSVGYRSPLFLDSPSVIVDKIQQGNPESFFRRERRHENSPDFVHDVFVEVLESILDSRIRSADRLIGFVWAVARHQNARARHRSGRTIGQASGTPDQAPQERAYLDGERRSEMLRRIADLPWVDQQIVSRFYLEEEPWTKIWFELGFTPTQFRLRKHRAKRHLACHCIPLTAAS